MSYLTLNEQTFTIEVKRTFSFDTHILPVIHLLQGKVKDAFDLEEEDCPIGIKRFAHTEYSDWEDRQKVYFLKGVIDEYTRRVQSGEYAVSIFDFELVEQVVKKIISCEFEIAEEDLEQCEV